jgi:two-component system phosphate regulon sensor histidine kinase PhoR
VRLKIKWKFFWSIFLVCALSLISSGIWLFRQTEKQFLRQAEQDIISENQASELLAQQGKNLIRIVTLSIFISSVFSLLISILLAGRLTSPLKNMIKSAREIPKGNLKIRVKPETNDEISDLADSFNLMSEELETKMNQLENEKIQLSSILSNMKEGVLALNSKGKILQVNSALKKMFKLQEPALNNFYYEVFRSPQLRDLIDSVLKQREAQSQELNLGFPEEKILLTQVSPIQMENEEEISTILVFFDITPIKKLERIRKDFVANVSHELRTPLTSIKGFVEALQDGAIKDSKQARHFLSIISQQTERMNHIISDLLLLSQIESEGYQLKKERFSLKGLISEVLEELRGIAEKRSQQLKVNFDSGEYEIKADREKIEQVLINLLDNAIKFTPENRTIEIIVSKNQNQIQISIKDDGIGIPSTDLPRIFERFYRVDKARSQEQGGTGLGLAIVKHIVEAHAGRVWVESELNRGSTFHFTLPQ